MNQFLISCQDKWELRELWENKFSRGVFFLQSSKPYSVNTSFNLCFRIEDKKIGAIIPARVIQLLNGGSTQATGMVAEFVQFSSYQRELNDLIEDLDDRNWSNLRDFRGHLQANPAHPLKSEAFLKKVGRFLKESDGKNYYALLGLSPKASKHQIKKSFNTLSRNFHPDTSPSDLKPEEILLFEKAYQKIVKAYETLTHEKNRIKYDFSHGILVQNGDEKRGDFKIKKMQYKIQKEKEKKRGIVGKAQRIFNQALKAEKEGDLSAALKSIRIALVHDPLNSFYRKKMKNLEQLVLEKGPMGQRKMEDLLLGEERRSLREDTGWFDK